MKKIFYIFATIFCGCSYASQDITPEQKSYWAFFQDWLNKPRMTARQVQPRLFPRHRAYRQYALLKYRKAVRESDNAMKAVIAAFEEYDRANFGLKSAQFFAHPYIVETFGYPEKPEDVEKAQKRYDRAYEAWQVKREKVRESEEKLFSKRRNLDAVTPGWCRF